MTAALPTPLGAPRAIVSVTRSMALTLGVGAIAFFALGVASIFAQAPAFGVAWTFAASLAIFGPLLAAAALSRWLSPRAVRALAAVTAIGQLATLVTLVPVLPGGLLDGTLGSPWPFGLTVLGCASAAVAWRAAITWPYVGATVVLVGLDRYLASEWPIPDLAVQDALHTLLFTSVFTSLALAIRRAGRRLDETSDRAVDDTRRVATADARLRERARVEALLHDSVLVALLASSRNSSRAAAAARDALERLDDLEHRGSESVPVAARDLMWRLQASATAIDAEARFSHALRERDPVPGDVAEALLEATAEALRNSVLHAGPAARAVHVDAGPSGVEVSVLDDGRGFDVDSVGEARLGLAVSIRDRMRSLPGGRADIVSRPGVGTRVTLTWEAP